MRSGRRMFCAGKPVISCSGIFLEIAIWQDGLPVLRSQVPNRVFLEAV